MLDGPAAAPRLDVQVCQELLIQVKCDLWQKFRDTSGQLVPTRIRGGRFFGSSNIVSVQSLPGDQRLPVLDGHWNERACAAFLLTSPQFADVVASLCGRHLPSLSHTYLSGTDQHIPTTSREIVEPADQFVLRMFPPRWSVQQHHGKKLEE